MCGLFGFITKNGRGPDLGLLKALAAITESRGTDAFGLAWADAHGGLHTYKRPGAATDSIADIDQLRGAHAVAGHCRLATRGHHLDNRNNHPHRAGAGWIAHNGTVRDHERLAERYRLSLTSECDSEVLAQLIGKTPGSLAERAARTAAKVTDSRLAILGVWANPARLLIVRNGNPLCLGERKHGFYFASLPTGLPGAVRLTDGLSAVMTFNGQSLTSRATRVEAPAGTAA